LALAVWCGAVFRFHSLFANTFHADEALFAGWARLIAAWRDPLLITQAVDKPPLLFYVQALSYPVAGPVEWAARMPSFIASLLLIPLTARAATITCDRQAGVVAAFVVALAPLAIQFSGTAFSDPLLTLWLTAALVSALQSRHLRSERPVRSRDSFWMGIFFGLALMTKYQAALFLPLFVGLAYLSGWRRSDWFRALAGLAAMMVLLLAWVAARPEAGGLLGLQWANIGGLRLSRSWELLSRFRASLVVWQLSLGRPMLIGLSFLSLGSLSLRRVRAAIHPAEALIAVFVVAYVSLHWLWAVPVWDRYLLPILPLVALIAGGALSRLWTTSRAGRLERLALGALAVLFIGLQATVAMTARKGAFPIGGQPTADGGAGAAARSLMDAPYGTVLYDHWYSWQWRYQLFDSRVYISWFPNVDVLLADLEVFAGSGAERYIALPVSDASRPIHRRLSESGYRLEPAAGQSESTGMVIYRIFAESAK
jgi:4-amino-4-deoxy-L-arabinose transferase-like glycosyltransferase